MVLETGDDAAQGDSNHDTSIQSKQRGKQPISKDDEFGYVVARILDIVLTYSIIIVIIAGAYPLLNKAMLDA